MSKTSGTSRIPAVLLAIAISALSGCGPGDRPPDAFGSSSDPLPPGAVEISESEYNELIAAGWRPFTPESLAAEAERAEALYQEDLAVIRAYEEAHPEVGDLLPAEPVPDGTTLRATGDGNFLSKLEGKDGERLEVVTFGRRWYASVIANALRTFPTKKNQLGIYRILYRAAPDRLKADLRLAPPDEVGNLEAAEILDLNLTLASDDVSQTILGALQPAEFAFKIPDVGFLSDCDVEIGVGTDSDRSPNHCNLNASGIVANYDWSLRSHLTCVKAQANRGTCTGFANTSAIETQVSVTHGRRVNLSEQAYYNRARLAWVAGGSFGDGLTSSEGFDGMENEGFLLYFEKQWNYNPSYSRIVDEAAKLYKDSCVGYTETCSNTTHQSAAACFNSAWWKWCLYWVPEKNPGHEGYRIGNSFQFWDPANPDKMMVWLKIALNMDYSVVLGHPVTSAWSAAKDGWIEYKAGDSGGGHGSHAVGYIDNDDLKKLLQNAPPGAGGGYLIIKNSSGTCAGDGGFFYMPYQSVLDYAADVTVLFSVL